MYEDRQSLMNSLLAADTEKHLKNSYTTTMFVPLRIEDGIGYYDREKTLDKYYAVFNIGLNPENIPQSSQGELKGIPTEKGSKYRITDCEQSSDGTFLYMKLNYEKINRHSPYLSITLHKCYPYYLFGISTFPSSVYHSIALRKFSITIV